jgi:hypothetical protein
MLPLEQEELPCRQLVPESSQAGSERQPHVGKTGTTCLLGQLAGSFCPFTTPLLVPLLSVLISLVLITTRLCGTPGSTSQSSRQQGLQAWGCQRLAIYAVA